MKKASTNVDWTISLGLFITYILFLFIFLKPGIQEVYKEDSLFSVIENNIYMEANHTVEAIPLYIDSPSTGYFQTECKDDFIKEWEENSIALIDDNRGDFQSQNLIFSISNKKMKMGLALKNGINNFIILHSNKETYEVGIDGCKEDCTGHPVSCNECNPDLIKLDCVFGTQETISGLNEENLNSISSRCNIDYESLKEKWNFPMNKEFAIYLKKGDSYENFCNTGNEQNQTNVFVKEFNDFILTKYGNGTGATFNIRIW